MGVIYGIDQLSDKHEKYDVIQNDIVDNADICIIGSGEQVRFLPKSLSNRVGA